MKGFLGLSLLPLLAAASPVIKTGVYNGEAAPLISSTNAKEIADSYIVVFKKHVTHNLASEHHAWIQDLHLNTQNTKAELRKRSQMPMADTIFEGLKHTYNIGGSLMGYSGHFDEDVVEQVRNHPDVSTPLSSPRWTRKAHPLLQAPAWRHVSQAIHHTTLAYNNSLYTNEQG